MELLISGGVVPLTVLFVLCTPFCLSFTLFYTPSYLNTLSMRDIGFKVCFEP